MIDGIERLRLHAVQTDRPLPSFSLLIGLRETSENRLSFSDNLFQSGSRSLPRKFN